MSEPTAGGIGRLAAAAMGQMNRPVALHCSPRRGSLHGKRVLVTGASSGIGRAVAVLLARHGASVIAVARRERELLDVCAEISGSGGEAAYRVCDLTSSGEVDGLLLWLTQDVGGVEVVINNAGRSIRRPVASSVGRMHDVQRMMAINYFAPVQLMVGLLPSMLEGGEGHMVNVGTWTVPVGTSPRFSAYHSAKVALAGFGRCVGAELAGQGVHVTAVHYPLVHTAMSAPTGRYRGLPGLSADEAAGWVLTAVRKRPVCMLPRYAVLLGALDRLSPRAVDRVLLRWG
jgi:NAD(P)-dependent dehydrogenase (short-subunit alcohol dehydrogenase family)